MDINQQQIVALTMRADCISDAKGAAPRLRVTRANIAVRQDRTGTCR